jgi:hypothetical protein
MRRLLRDNGGRQLLQLAHWMSTQPSIDTIVSHLKRLATYSLVGQMDDTMLSNCLSFLNYTEFAPLPCINHRFKRLVPNVGRCVMLTWSSKHIGEAFLSNPRNVATIRTLRIRVEAMPSPFPSCSRVEALFLEWKPKLCTYSQLFDRLVAIYPLLPSLRRIDIYTGCEPSEGDPEHYGEHDPRGPLELAKSLIIPLDLESLILSPINERPTLIWYLHYYFPLFLISPLSHLLLYRCGQVPEPCSNCHINCYPVICDPHITSCIVDNDPTHVDIAGISQLDKKTALQCRRLCQKCMISNQSKFSSCSQCYRQFHKNLNCSSTKVLRSCQQENCTATELICILCIDNRCWTCGRVACSLCPLMTCQKCDKIMCMRKSCSRKYMFVSSLSRFPLPFGSLSHSEFIHTTQVPALHRLSPKTIQINMILNLSFRRLLTISSLTCSALFPI